jgi:hypothetical protein
VSRRRSTYRRPEFFSGDPVAFMFGLVLSSLLLAEIACGLVVLWVRSWL